MEHDFDQVKLYDGKLLDWQWPKIIESQLSNLRQCRRCGAWINSELVSGDSIFDICSQYD